MDWYWAVGLVAVIGAAAWVAGKLPSRTQNLNVTMTDLEAGGWKDIDIGSPVRSKPGEQIAVGLLILLVPLGIVLAILR